MKRLTIALVVLVILALMGCQRGSISEEPPPGPLGMETPIDPATALPSPLYEPKTEEEKAAAREASDRAEAQQVAEREAALSWAKENCQIKVFRMCSRFFEITSQNPICLVRLEGNCPHGVIASIDNQEVATSGEPLGETTSQVYFSREGASLVALSADDNDGSVAGVYITKVELWSLIAPP
jgi:hypothetical protein